MEEETQEEYFARIGINGVGLEEIQENYTENSEEGIIHHKIVTKVFKDGAQISKTNHRQVLDESQGDYSDKLAIVTKGVQGTLAVQQSQLLRQKDSEKDDLGQLNQVLTKNLEEEKAKSRALELELSSLKKFDTKELER